MHIAHFISTGCLSAVGDAHPGMPITCVDISWLARVCGWHVFQAAAVLVAAREKEVDRIEIPEDSDSDDLGDDDDDPDPDLLAVRRPSAPHHGMAIPGCTTPDAHRVGCWPHVLWRVGGESEHLHEVRFIPGMASCDAKAPQEEGSEERSQEGQQQQASLSRLWQGREEDQEAIARRAW